MRTTRVVDDAVKAARSPVNAASGRPGKANFFIVGAPKCGTTAWYEYLRSHPDVYFPEMKEPCFFATDFPSLRQVGSERDYDRLFIDGGSARIIGDASADYLFSTAAAEGIARYNPDARILILLRDQEEFLPSIHNQHLLGFWEEIEDFERAWSLSERGRAPAACTEPRMLDYRAMGRFDEQVARYLDAFPREQVLVLRFRDWTADPRAAYLRILEFLALPDDGRSDFPQINQGTSYRSRGLVRFFVHPPNWIRTVLRPAKRLLALESGALVGKATGLLSRPGYKKQISPSLRQEVRRYYAEDNARLEARLNSSSTSRKRRKRNVAAESCGT